MSLAKCSQADFIVLFEAVGAAALARRFGVTERNVYRRRKNIERMIGRKLVPPNSNMSRSPDLPLPEPHPAVLKYDIQDGVVLIGSDAHYWPGFVTTAHRAFVEFCKRLKPRYVIMNGDVIDGATISRYPPMNWNRQPTLMQELEEAQVRLEEIRKAAPKAEHVWTGGNHDFRYEMKLAQVAPEFCNVRGTRLKDHFPKWKPCYRVSFNNAVEVKHRFKGGIHAAYNNAVKSGRTICTGHLHSLQVRPVSDFNGTRWGVDTGMLADPEGPQFEYTEENPKDWRSGFVVLTFRDGRLLQPELAEVVDEGEVSFRSELIEI